MIQVSLESLNSKMTFLENRLYLRRRNCTNLLQKWPKLYCVPSMRPYQTEPFTHVLFCVARAPSQGLLDNEDIRVMMQGSSMVKVRSSRWQKNRNMRLLEDGLTVWCESTKSSRKAKSQQTCKCSKCVCLCVCSCGGVCPTK